MEKIAVLIPCYNEEITIGEAAELISVNASYFCRLFKKATYFNQL